MARILFFDDEESIRMLYEDELFEEGYEVITSGDGSKVLELIDQIHPDLVILDIRLGGYNGLDLLQDIRKNHYNLPVILCTAYSTYKYELRSTAADYYVVKRSDLTELKIKIKMALETNMQVMEKEIFKNDSVTTSYN